MCPCPAGEVEQEPYAVVFWNVSAAVKEMRRRAGCWTDSPRAGQAMEKDGAARPENREMHMMTPYWRISDDEPLNVPGHRGQRSCGADPCVWSIFLFLASRNKVKRAIHWIGGECRQVTAEVHAVRALETLPSHERRPQCC